MLRRSVIRFVNDQSGATAIEYGLIAALIAIGVLAAMTSFGGSLSSLFGDVQTRAGSAMDGATGS